MYKIVGVSDRERQPGELLRIKVAEAEYSPNPNISGAYEKEGAEEFWVAIADDDSHRVVDKAVEEDLGIELWNGNVLFDPKNRSRRVHVVLHMP